MARLVATILCVVGLVAPCAIEAAYAQERPEPLQLDLSSVRVMAVDAAMRGEIDQRSFPIPPAPKPRGSAMLGSLYATTALMQALDVHSTIVALDRGAVEANPLMAGVTRNKAAFIATKAAVATGTILAARGLSKRNKVAAVISLVALNTAYGFIVQNNYRIARGLK